jgi:hypothetical protein
MAIGPVQLLVIGFKHGDFHGQNQAELDRLRHSDTIHIRETIRSAGGFHLADSRIHPLDLVAIGLMPAEEAEQEAA